jgi:hypothetical protein
MYAGIIFIIKLKTPTIIPKMITKGKNVKNIRAVQQQLLYLLERFLQKQMNLYSIGM